MPRAVIWAVLFQVGVQFTGFKVSAVAERFDVLEGFDFAVAPVHGEGEIAGDKVEVFSVFRMSVLRRKSAGSARILTLPDFPMKTMNCTKGLR